MVGQAERASGLCFAMFFSYRQKETNGDDHMGSHLPHNHHHLPGEIIATTATYNCISYMVIIG